MSAFAIFGMRPRDADDLFDKDTDDKYKYVVDSTFIFSKYVKYMIALFWAINYMIQGIYVRRKLKRAARAEANAKAETEGNVPEEGEPTDGMKVRDSEMLI
jgi:hypothetical protein